MAALGRKASADVLTDRSDVKTWRPSTSSGRLESFRTTREPPIRVLVQTQGMHGQTYILDPDP